MTDFPSSGKPQTSAPQQGGKQGGRLGMRLLVRHAKSVNLFYLISGVGQVVLGAIVTMVAILNLVSPIWLAAFLSLLGCVVTMLGVYQVYEVLNSRRSVSDLARDAIERAIQDRN